jgi:hypothetical protein
LFYGKIKLILAQGGMYEPESIVLLDFLYRRQRRQYQQGGKGAVYQPARHQQIDPEAGGELKL